MKNAALILALALPCSIAGAQAEWTIGTRPILDVAGIDANGTVVFQNLGGATRLSNGGLLVADRGSTSIRLIDATGKLVSNVGRQGDGPGEYRIIISSNGCGQDSLLVWARETTVMVGASGAAARQFKIPADSSRLMPLMSLSCSNAGTITYLTQPTGRIESSTPGMMMAISSVATVTREGRVLARVDSVPSGEWMPVTRGAFPRPLGPSTSVTMVGNQVVLGVSDSSRAWVLQPGGGRSVIRIPSSPRAPTKQEFDDAVEAVAGMAPVQFRASILPDLAKAPVPKVLPPYFGLIGDTEGLLWVQLSPPGAKQTQFVAMQLNGQVVARPIIPMAFSIYEIGRDYILGTYDDANGETHLAVLRLARR